MPHVHIVITQNRKNSYEYTANTGSSDHYATIKTLWSQLPTVETFIARINDANQCVALGYIYPDRKYGTMLYTAFNSSGIVICYGGEFSHKQF